MAKGEEQFEFKLELEIWGRKLTARGRLPTEPMRVVDLLPVINSLSGAVEGAGVERLESEGKSISCRQGCGACCRQPVPIGEMEAVRLRELVDAMPEERRDEIRRRFDRAIGKLEEHGLLDRLRDLTKLKSAAARQAFALQYFWLHLDCPFLEDESCSIHRDRPLACREYLVTSPAEHCSDPNPEQVRVAPLPDKLTHTLFRFADGKGDAEVKWLPLILAMEWADARRDEELPRYSGESLVQNFVHRVAARLEDLEKEDKKKKRRGSAF